MMKCIFLVRLPWSHYTDSTVQMDKNIEMAGLKRYMWHLSIAQDSTQHKRVCCDWRNCVGGGVTQDIAGDAILECLGMIIS